MFDLVRKHASLIIAVMAIAVLAASHATAQDETTKPPAAVPAAGVNADTVDGRHAVGAAASLAARAGRLVATNAEGYLPANIVKKATDADKLDGVDSSGFARTAALKSGTGAVNQADNPVHWNQLKGVPAGIADGKDAVGPLLGFYVNANGGKLTAGSGDGGVDVFCDAGDVATGGSAGADLCPDLDRAGRADGLAGILRPAPRHPGDGRAHQRLRRVCRHDSVNDPALAPWARRAPDLSAHVLQATSGASSSVPELTPAIHGAHHGLMTNGASRTRGDAGVRSGSRTSVGQRLSDR
jgi:hypothetical protein